MSDYFSSIGKCFLISVAASAVVSASAQAGENDAGSWTGPYAGLKAGAAQDQPLVDRSFYWNGTAFNELSSNTERGNLPFSGGVLAGYNYQVSHFVFGGEVDFNALNLDSSSEQSYGLTYPPIGNLALGIESSLECDWFGTARIRGGYAWNSVLFYGTGGVAYGHVSADGTAQLMTVLGSGSWSGGVDQTNVGWTAGAGVEYAVGKWSLGLEGLFVDLGSLDLEENPANAPIQFSADRSVDYRFTTVTAALRRHF